MHFKGLDSTAKVVQVFIKLRPLLVQYDANSKEVMKMSLKGNIPVI